MNDLQRTSTDELASSIDWTSIAVGGSSLCYYKVPTQAHGGQLVSIRC
jgi:hypothetical protein